MTFRCSCGKPATIGFGKEANPDDPTVIPFRDWCSECFAAEHPERVDRLSAAAAVAQDYLDDRRLSDMMKGD